MNSALSICISTLPADTELMDAFPRWIIEECDRGNDVLEIGAGEGKAGYPETIRRHVGRLVGIDPDGAIERNPFLDDRYQSTLEDFARTHPHRYDCLYSMFVLEHVSDPAAFVAACRTLLKPGGKLFAATPNRWHYFGGLTSAVASVGLEDWLLERLRGRETKDSYHFPTAYRMNSVRRLSRALASQGFRELEVRSFDNPGRFEVYLPERARWMTRMYSNLVYSLHLPKLMGILMFKATL